MQDVRFQLEAAIQHVFFTSFNQSGRQSSWSLPSGDKSIIFGYFASKNQYKLTVRNNLLLDTPSPDCTNSATMFPPPVSSLIGVPLDPRERSWTPEMEVGVPASTLIGVEGVLPGVGVVAMTLVLVGCRILERMESAHGLVSTHTP